MSSFIAIGDIHGDIAALEQLLASIQGKFAKYIFLGDYIDRGMDSKGVIERLIKFSESNDSIFLKGNHEEMFLKYLRDGDIVSYARNGGLATLYSYLLSNARGDIHKMINQKLPPAHLGFFNSLVCSYQIDKYHFIHNIDKVDSLNKDFIYIHGHGESRSHSTQDQLICLNQNKSNEIQTFSAG